MEKRIVELKDKLKLKDRRIEELRREIDEARDLIKEQIDDAEAAIDPLRSLRP
jgi:signal transduction histidine kinase